MIEFKVEEKNDFTIVYFELKGNIKPELLKELKPPKVNSTKGVILSGRGPIWLYCYLTHYYHPTKFIATYDPRLGGAIVVESHDTKHRVGEVVEIES